MYLANLPKLSYLGWQWTRLLIMCGKGRGQSELHDFGFQISENAINFVEKPIHEFPVMPLRQSLLEQTAQTGKVSVHFHQVAYGLLAFQTLYPCPLRHPPHELGK